MTVYTNLFSRGIVRTAGRVSRGAPGIVILLLLTSGVPAQAADNDGLPSWWEKQFRLSPAKRDGHRDPDFDGLSNRLEFRLRINPRRKDTDHDGMEDGIEVRFGFNPRRPDADGDKDRDGVSNIDETRGTRTNQLPPGPTGPGGDSAGTPVPSSSSLKGQFVVNCARTDRKELDPIIAPRRPGGFHSHDFFGPLTVRDDALPSDLIREPTSCSVDADRSAYWAPTLYNSGGSLQEGGVLQAYYFIGSRARAFPRGLAMIAGDSRATVTNPQSASWSCQPSANYGQTTLPSCPPEGYVLSEIRFPECWNGRDLDSSDHRSHMAYFVDGKCPASHPVELPELVLFRTYTQYDGPLYECSLSSGSTGGLHGDFVSGWDEGELTRLMNNCRDHSCGVLG